MSQDNADTAAKRVFDAATAEYNALKDEQRDRIARRDNYTWVALGAAGAVFYAALQTSRWELLLAVPVVLLILTMKMIRNDRKIVEIRRYIAGQLRPLLQHLATPVTCFGSTKEPIPILGWETGDRGRGHLIFDLVTFVGPAIVACTWFGAAGIPAPPGSITTTMAVIHALELVAAMGATILAGVDLGVHHRKTAGAAQSSRSTDKS